MDPVPSREIADMSGQAALPRKNGELVFDEAWQGRIFGMTVAMSHEACFAWREFQAQLIAEIAHAEREGESSSYYERWLHAFERLLADKGLLDAGALAEHKFRAAVDDAWAATRWVAAHGSELGVDARRLAVAGDSAGGNLAAVVALLAREAGAPAIALQVLVYPVTDVSAESQSYRDFAEGYLLTRESMRWFTNHYLKSASDADDWRASPLRAPSLAGLPPALVVTAGFDPLRDEG